MTLSEFKAWFDGFTSEIDIPSRKQWNRIKEMMSQIDNVQTTGSIFINKYVMPWYSNYPMWCSYSSSASIVAKENWINLGKDEATHISLD